MADTATRKRDPDDLLQIRVWITQAKYDQLKLRARHHDSSVAAEVRALMDAGEQRTGAAEQLERKLDSVMNYLTSHLEPLAFIAAMDAAFSRESWRLQFYGSRPADAETVDRQMGERATKRIRRKLHQLPDPTEQQPKDDKDDKEEGESDDENDGA